MQSVLLIDNPLDRDSWERHEVADVRPFLMERFAAWPAGARIYAGEPAEPNDVTPHCRSDVERLGTYPELTVIIYPEGPTLLLAAIAIAVVATVALMLFLPKIPGINQQALSPNNGLSDRVNRPRPGGRIPDIFGQVRSIPDLIAVPYRVFENHRELEIALMCIGRGSYEVEDIRDGDTLVENIEGASLAIYGPFTSPNSGDYPDTQIGTFISDPVFNVARLNEVNGQVLRAPNDTAVRSDEEIIFADGGIVQASGGDIDFTEFFSAGQTITIGRATDSGTTADASAILVAAEAFYPDLFVFTGYDPRDDFQAGQTVSILGAQYTYFDGTPTGGGTPGDLSVAETNPNYPYNQIP